MAIDYNAQMLNYYPEIIKAIKDFQELIKVQSFEVEEMHEELAKILTNAYVSTADESNLAKWEKFLGITPLEQGEDDLETWISDRRETILARLYHTEKMNSKSIEDVVKIFTGGQVKSYFRDGVIYVLHFCNEHFLGSAPEHVYRIYVSKDNGVSFKELCVVPFPDTTKRGYGSILFDEFGYLHAFAYNESKENELDHVVSKDCGKTWEVLKPCYLEKCIRNPQTALIVGVYIIHGRAWDSTGFVFYTSDDCETWDEGTYLHEQRGACYYSNNINLKDEKGNFLLIQYSKSYMEHPYSARVNVQHVVLRVKKK